MTTYLILICLAISANGREHNIGCTRRSGIYAANPGPRRVRRLVEDVDCAGELTFLIYLLTNTTQRTDVIRICLATDLEDPKSVLGPGLVEPNTFGGSMLV